MTPCIEEALRLLALAKRDLETFRILHEHPRSTLEAKGFHAQQAVEKALKAVLTSRDVAFPRTHNLEELANLIADSGLAPPLPPRELRRLNPFAVEARYSDPLVPLVSGEEAGNIAAGAVEWANDLIHSQTNS